MALKNWCIDDVVADTVTDLVAAAADKVAAIVGFQICNCEAEDAAQISVYITDSSNTVKATIIKDYDLIVPDSLFVETKIFLADEDKIRVKSSKANVSFAASGDES